MIMFNHSTIKKQDKNHFNIACIVFGNKSFLMHGNCYHLFSTFKLFIIILDY